MSLSQLLTTAITSLRRGGGALMRTAVAAAVACLILGGFCAADEAQALAKKQTNIPAQELGSALQALAKDRDLQVIYISEEVNLLRTTGAVGQFTADEALIKLLTGTGLTYRYLDDRTITVLPIPSGAPSATSARGNATSAAKDTRPTQAMDAKEAQKQSFWDRFRLAQVDQAQTASDGSVEKSGAASENSDRPKLEEIIVTAQKRSERLQDVPVPVTALSADTLVNQNQLRLQDYYTSVPGLSMAAGDLHGSLLAIRGVTTGGFTNPTVGITVDDVPYGSSSALGGYGNEAPDIDPSELARVEVLRGPQGTLYGASSIGGLIKFVTVDPSTNGISGRLQAGTTSVQQGDEFGYSVRGSVNVPLSNDFAVRASGFTRREPGYIDNPGLAIDDVNQIDVDGGRLSALWRPSQIFSLKLSALLQHTKTDGSSLVFRQPGLGDLQQNAVFGTGTSDKRFQAYSATLNVKLGRADFTSVSGYNINKATSLADLPALSGASQFFFGVAGTAVPEHYKTNKFTQEIRLSGPVGQKLDWLLGVFYTHEKSENFQDIIAVEPATGAPAGTWLNSFWPTTYREYAAFTDVTFHVTDRFDLQVGGRESENEQSYSTVWTGPFVAFLSVPSPLINPEVDTKENSFTYLVTPQFRVSPDLMLYARLASGYRPGGPNSTCLAFHIPCKYAPDKTQNYEIGIKGDVLNRMLSFDASLYYIDWKDIQLQLNDPTSGSSFFDNGSRAKSQGVELSIESRPLTGLTVTTWLAWNDAQLTEDFPATSAAYGFSGDRLPYSSRFSGNFSLDQEFPLMNNVTGFVGGAVSYVGDRKGIITSRQVQLRETFPAYAKVDLRAGAKYESWAASIFVNNVADRRGLLSGGLGTIYLDGFTYIQPRTFGLTVSRTFD
jgi:iron complex outermembrane receptor protein